MAALKSIWSSRVSSEWDILERQFSCQEATVRHIPDIPGGVLSFNRTVHSRIEHETPSLSWCEMCQTEFLQHWLPNSPNPVDCSTWSVLRKKVYRSTIANVSELDMSLINERGRFVQSIVEAAIGQWRVVSALVSVERGTLWAPNIKFQLFCHVSTRCY